MTRVLRYQSKALTVLDSRNWVRANLLKRYLSSTIDAIRFYHLMGSQRERTRSHTPFGIVDLHPQRDDSIHLDLQATYRLQRRRNAAGSAQRQ